MSVSLSAILSQTVVGLSLGMIYVLLALGLSLIFGMLGVVNFAHGSLFLLGAYLGFFVLGLTGNFWLALVIGPILVGLIGLAVERVLIRPLADRGTDAALLVTFGFSLVVVDLVRMVWGKRGVPFDAPTGLNRAVDLGWTLIPTYRLFVVGATIAVLVALWAFLLRTDLGLVIRAGTRDPLMTRALGIRLVRVRFLVFGLGATLAGLAGVLTAPMRHVFPEMGVNMLITGLRGRRDRRHGEYTGRRCCRAPARAGGQLHLAVRSHDGWHRHFHRHGDRSAGPPERPVR